MKKILCFVLICATILSISAFAEDFDVYSYTYDELVTIRELVDDRLKELDKLAEQAAKETECFQVYIDVTSEYYVFSDRYDVELYLDNTLLATIPNGEEFYQLLEVTKGQHTFTFYKKGDHKVHYSKTVIVSMDVMYSGDIVHEDEISLINFQIDFGLSKAFIELTNKSGMLLSSAESALKADGFVNIRYEPYADIWNTDNWLVISQDPQSATSLDKHEKVTLYCTAFEDHLSSEYVGKDAYTTTEYCKSLGISCTYRDSDSNEKLTSSFSKMNKAEMEKWEVRSVSYSSKSATIYVKKVGSSIPTKKPTATPTKKPTATPTKKPTATPTKKPTATPTKKPTATPTKKPTATPTKKPTATPTKIPQNITIENNADFAYYFKQPSEIYQTCDSFVKSHKGEYVEFDGYVVSLQNHGTYSTRYDVMLCGFTTYSNAFTEMKGFFSFSDVNFNDMHVSGSDTVSRGLAFHIIGKVVGISEDGLSMLLKPVSMQYLDPDVDRRTNVPNTDTPNTSTNTVNH